VTANNIPVDSITEVPVTLSPNLDTHCPVAIVRMELQSAKD
jgi:hypothetical protein